ncbi:MAG: glycine oxidase ThiO [Proteobacteria bacterium]|nr:glycine oxidase ThiO [Pseudomonadota bacterium]
MKIVIVGAGVAGLATGWRLVQAGAEVTVLERAQAGQGATWAAAGMLETVEGDDAPDAVFGRHSATLWPAFACELEAQTGISVRYRPDGVVIAARTDEETAHLKAQEAKLSRRGRKARWLDGDEARALEPLLALDVLGALYDSEEAQADNRALGRALARAFVRAGGKLLVNESVVRIEIRDGRAIGALTPFALHEGDAVLLAAGAWTSRLEGIPPDAIPPTIPMKGEMIALTPPQRPGGGTAVPKHLIWGNGIYCVPREDCLLIGATLEDAGFDTATTLAAAQWLNDSAARLLPALASWELAEHWAGLRPGTPDGLPILGETAVSGLFAAAGQFRNGILFAPAIADALSDLILGRRNSAAISPFDPRRFSGSLAGRKIVP